MSTESQEPNRVPVYTRFLNIFFGLYFFLAFFPFPFALLFQHVGSERYYEFAKGYEQFLLPAAKWTAGTFFHDANAVVLQPTGAGDTAYEYSMKLLWLIVTLAATSIWVVVDRKGKTFVHSNDLFRMSVRFLLITTLFGYGFGKLMQFPPISDTALDSTWGDTSPMGVIWNMMRSNPNYTACVGLLEASPGFLLMFRRTSALGGLLAAGVMTHIWLLNMFYDIPVKLHSMHYIIMGLYLASPLFGRLLNVFILNRPSEPISVIPPVRWRWLRTACVAFGVIFWGTYSYTSINGWWTSVKGLSEVKPPLEATWEVKSYTKNGKELVGSVSELYWSKISFTDDTAVFTNSKNLRMYAGFDLDEKKNTFSIETAEGKNYEVKYELEGNNLTIEGDLTDGPVLVIARKKSVDRVIFSKPFKWISETPDNR